MGIEKKIKPQNVAIRKKEGLNYIWGVQKESKRWQGVCQFAYEGRSGNRGKERGREKLFINIETRRDRGWKGRN